MFKAIRATIAAAALACATLVTVPAFSGTYLQCVVFARAESGINIFGNAREWWAKADGLYDKGHEPRTGAVMAFAPTGAMPVGHVAVVSRVISDREVLLNHANWSPINGRRGQVERNVRAVDVSPAGDWSQVRVWYAPIHDLGLRVNPVRGFIYPSAAHSAETNTTIATRDMTPDRDGTLAAIVASVGA